MAEQLEALRPIVEHVLATRHLPEGGVRVPGDSHYLAIYKQLGAAAIADGMSTAQDEVDDLRARAARRRGGRPHEAQHFDDSPKQPSVPTPREAVEWLRNRAELQGKWSRDLDAAVTRVLVNALQHGATTQQVMDALRRDVFPSFSRARLENIARTESTAAFNQGRLAMFRRNADFVIGVQFIAIIDDRTTDICRERDGLIMGLDDPRVAENTPPLHFQCRSVLSPIDKYDWADLEAGDAATEKRIFGWIKERSPAIEQAPTNLKEAMARWARVSSPTAGFGGVSTSASKRPRKPRKTPAKTPKPPPPPNPPKPPKPTPAPKPPKPSQAPKTPKKPTPPLPPGFPPAPKRGAAGPQPVPWPTTPPAATNPPTANPKGVAIGVSTTVRPKITNTGGKNAAAYEPSVLAALQSLPRRHLSFLTGTIQFGSTAMLKKHFSVTVPSLRKLTGIALPSRLLAYQAAVERAMKTSVARKTTLGATNALSRDVFAKTDPMVGGVADFVNTLLHEIGHNVDFGYNLRGTTRLKAFYAQAKLHNLFPTPYSRTSETELFAECYQLYIREPDRLLKVFPAMYNFLRDDVFSGVEYK